MAKTELRGGQRGGKSVEVAALGLDAVLLQQLGASVTAFLAKLGEFFATASTIEVAAKSALAKAQAWTQPTTLEQDEALKDDIRRVTAQLKAAEDHWAITAAVSKFHRMLTSRRAVATDALEEARRLGTSLHTGWTAAEQRRVAEENRRRQAEADRVAREEREREAADLEAQAVAAEEACADLSDREQRFVDAFCSDVDGWKGDGVRAATVAGFKDGFKSSARLLSLPKIQMAIKAKQGAATIRRQASAVRERPLEATYQPAAAQADTKGDRVTHGAEVVDEERLIDAAIAGGYGVPRDVLMVNRAKVNDYAKQLQGRIGMWPGVKHTTKTAVI